MTEGGERTMSVQLQHTIYFIHQIVSPMVVGDSVCYECISSLPPSIPPPLSLFPYLSFFNGLRTVFMGLAFSLWQWWVDLFCGSCKLHSLFSFFSGCYRVGFYAEFLLHPPCS